MTKPPPERSAKLPTDKKPASLNKDHRQRVRARVIEAGAEALSPHEILEFLLFYAYPRQDTKDRAKQVIAEFGSLEAVLGASTDALRMRAGLPDTAISMLKVVRAASLRLLKREFDQDISFTRREDVTRYLHAKLADSPIEEFHVLFLDRRNRLLREEKLGSGTIDHTPVYPREVIKKALQLDAAAILLVHNHPSGDATPSRADIQLTRDIEKIGKSLGIVLHDHIIIAKKGHVSLRGEGVI